MPVGAFRATGGDVSVSGTWVPSPESVEAELLKVAGNLENIARPLIAAQRIAKDDIQAHFDSESDPDGNKWVPLDDDYARYKESLGYPADILHRTGDLEAAAVSDAAFVVTDDSLFYNVGALPMTEEGDYNLGMLHQVGTGDGTGGQFATSIEELKNLSSEDFEGVGRGNALPARPFIGLSDIAELEIADVFDLWFDASISVAINPTTGIVQERTASGQFGKRI